MNDLLVMRASLLASLCFAANLAMAQPAPAAAKVVPAEAKAASSAKPVDSIVAVVNDSVITKQELDRRMSEALRQFKQQNRPAPAADVLQRQILEQMIVTRVQLQAAKERSIAVSDADVERAVQRVAADNHMSIDQYRTRLQSVGVSWSVFRQEVRDQITMGRLRDSEVDSKVQVSESEINTFLAAQRGASAAPSATEYRLAQILVKVPEGATSEQVDAAQKKAEAALSKAKSGADFSQLAQQYSESSDAAKGGDMGYRIPERIPDLLLAPVSKLSAGQVVPTVLRSSNGFHVVKLLETRQQGAGQEGITVPQIHARHILIRVGDGVSDAQARQKLLAVKAQLEKGQGDFADFARRLSADGSAAQGGDLGWISPGETVPAFERALSEMKDGQISDPIMTEYGYHLIQVLGHRESQIGGDKERNLAMQALRSRKAEQQYRDWLQQLRDTAYVDYRIPNAQ